jgi:hypothetical protein
MSQFPPASGYPDPAGFPPLPGAYPPQPTTRGSSAWKWIVGIVGLMIFMPCLCCSGCLAYSMTIKDLTISNGEHLGGSPMNVRIDYAFRDDGSRGPLKSYYMVVQAANGTRRERQITGGFAFGMGGVPSVPMSGTWHFGNAVDLGPENNKRYVKVWIESEAGGGRSTASNTLTIYPKS